MTILVGRSLSGSRSISALFDPNVVSLNVVSDGEETKSIGSVDANAARWYVHKEAIYLHDAEDVRSGGT